jgi:hypothetical protein
MAEDSDLGDLFYDLLKDTSNNGRFCRVGAQRRVLFAI